MTASRYASEEHGQTTNLAMPQDTSGEEEPHIPADSRTYSFKVPSTIQKLSKTQSISIIF